MKLYLEDGLKQFEEEQQPFLEAVKPKNEVKPVVSKEPEIDTQELAQELYNLVWDAIEKAGITEMAERVAKQAEKEFFKKHKVDSEELYDNIHNYLADFKLQEMSITDLYFFGGL